MSETVDNFYLGLAFWSDRKVSDRHNKQETGSAGLSNSGRFLGSHLVFGDSDLNKPESAEMYHVMDQHIPSTGGSFHPQECKVSIISHPNEITQNV